MAGPSLLQIPYTLERDVGPFTDIDNRFAESLVRHFIKEHTKKGDKIFDPFAGLGTALFVAEEMGRKAYGMETDNRLAEWVAGQLENWTGVINDDAAKMLHYDFPKMDFVITSPPFMGKDHKWNPLYAGDPSKAGYDKYLKRLQHIFGQLSKLVKRGGTVIVHLDNVYGRSFTPLVADAGRAISANMRLEDDILVQWKTAGKTKAPEDYPYTHCLVFKNK